MIIDSLALRNFMAYRNRVAVDLRGKHTVGVAGCNESGKSSLLQAVTYGLFGRTKVDRELKLINDDASGPLVVELAVTLPGGVPLEIERGRTRKNEAILNVSGFRGKKGQAEEYLAQKIQLDYHDFIDLSYFVQGDIHGFMTGNKREYFRRWTRGLEHWAQLEAKAKAWHRELSADLLDTVKECDKAQALMEETEAVKRGLRAAKQARHESKRMAEYAQERIATLMAQLEMQKTAADVEEAIDTLIGESDRTATTIQSLRHRQDIVRREFTKIGRGECPVMEDVHCKRLEKQGEVRRRALNEELALLGDQVQSHADHSRDVSKRLGKLRRRLPEKKNDSAIKVALDEAKRDLANANRDAAMANSNLGALKVRGEKVRKASAQHRALDRRAKELDRKLRRIQFLCYMTGKSGVPMRIIESELDLVEQKCNWVFERLGYRKRIRFAAFKELAGYEKVCPVCGGETWKGKLCSGCGAPRPHTRKDDPTITILDGANERSFDLESGGAQVLESFAARLAGGLFRASMTGLPMDLIMLDEVFAHLDADNRKALMGLVIEKLATEFGLKQQLVVSHHEDVIHAVDDLLIVTKERGQPTVQWA